MKKLIIIHLFLLMSTYLYAQKERTWQYEIFPETINALYEDYKYEIEPVSGKTTWCMDYQTWEIVTNATSSDIEIEGNSCIEQYIGFDVCYDTPQPKFWLTLNKVTIYKWDEDWEEVFYFYIDYRDCRYGAGSGNDISILIDDGTGKVYYDHGIQSVCDTSNYTEISEGATLNFWEGAGWEGSHDISCMCDTPTLISVTNYNNHPKVLWSHDDDPNGSYSYEVWRLLTLLPYPIGTWYLRDTVTDTSFVDAELSVGDYGYAYYKVKATIDDLESEFSDYDYIGYRITQKPVVQNTEIIEITEFKLHTSYPNPFNSSTIITFDIPEQSPVELTIYDIQGKKVVTLVNRILEKGSYSVEFDASNLPSGTYLYKLVAGEYTESKKMHYIK